MRHQGTRQLRPGCGAGSAEPESPTGPRIFLHAAISLQYTRPRLTSRETHWASREAAVYWERAIARLQEPFTKGNSARGIILPPRHPRVFRKIPNPSTQSLPAPSKAPPFSSPFSQQNPFSCPPPAAVLPDGYGTEEAQAQGGRSAPAQSSGDAGVGFSGVVSVRGHYRQNFDRSFPIEPGGCKAQSILVNPIPLPSGECGVMAQKVIKKRGGGGFCKEQNP